MRKNSTAAWVRKHQLFKKVKVKYGKEKNQQFPISLPAPTDHSPLKIQFEELILSEGFVSDGLRHDKKEFKKTAVIIGLPHLFLDVLE